MIIQYLYDILSETLYSIKSHKTRTILTGVGIAWGMFILIILLGIGNGLRNGILAMFGDYSSNSVWLYGGWVGKYVPGGLEIGTEVKFTDATINTLRCEFPQIKYISAEISLNKFNRVVRNNIIGNFGISGISKDYGVVKHTKLSYGRFINPDDINKSRRVVVIGEQVRHTLFGRDEVINQSIDIGGVPFRVIGVIDNNSIFSRADENQIFMPSTTAINTFNVSEEYSRIGMLMNETGNIDETLEVSLRDCISRMLSFDSNDYGALYINNVQLQVKAFNSMFDVIQYFLWFVGVCILLCGAIGVSNIMLLATKERFKEIGIRKSLGATCRSVMYMVLSESVMVTLAFGFMGVSLGYTAIIIYNYIRDILLQESKDILGSADVSLTIVITAFIILLSCGIMAGLYPAHKASHIQPVKALSRES